MSVCVLVDSPSILQKKDKLDGSVGLCPIIQSKFPC